jgi:hypothetical protein
MGMFLVASFIGVVIGAVLQYFFAQRAEQRRTVQLRRTEAYVDLIKAISLLSKLGGDNPGEATRQAAALLAEARARIAIYGSGPVNARLAEFLLTPGDFGSGAAGEALVNVVKAMRVDGLGEGHGLPDQDLRTVIFGRN